MFLLALFVLAEYPNDQENLLDGNKLQLGPNEEAVGESIDSNDGWCARDYDCAEGSGCINSQCFVRGKPSPHLSDLGNCVEIEVYGFDEYMSDIKDCANPGLVCDEQGRKIEHMDGTYMLLEKKSSSGGRVLKKLSTKYFDRDGRGWQKSVPVYMYWDASRNKWYFDDDVKSNYIMASSPRLADDSSNTKRWRYWLGAWHSNVPVSVHCKKYYEPSGYTDSCVNDFVEKKNWREKNGVCKTYYDGNWANDCACDCKNNKHVKDCAAYSIGYDSGLDNDIGQRKYKWDKEFRYCCFVDRSKFDWSQTEKSSYMEWNLYTVPGLAAKDTDLEVTEEEQLAAENGRLREANRRLRKALTQMQA